jgi:hypothetical protein
MIQNFEILSNKFTMYRIHTPHPLPPFQITIILGHFRTENVWNRKLSFGDLFVVPSWAYMYDEFL